MAIWVAQGGRWQISAGDDGPGSSDIFDPHWLWMLHRPW